MKTYLKLLPVLFILISCEKDGTEIQLDKQISFLLSIEPKAWGETVWSYPYENYGNCLINFNKSDYAEIKSIIISVPMCSYNENTTCYVDLYNLTDSVPIENSRIETNSLTMVYINSLNLIDYIPDKPIDLALRIMSSDYAGLYSVNVGIGTISYLFLYR